MQIHTSTTHTDFERYMKVVYRKLEELIILFTSCLMYSELGGMSKNRSLSRQIITEGHEARSEWASVANPLRAATKITYQGM